LGHLARKEIVKLIKKENSFSSRKRSFFSSWQKYTEDGETQRNDAQVKKRGRKPKKILTNSKKVDKKPKKELSTRERRKYNLPQRRHITCNQDKGKIIIYN